MQQLDVASFGLLSSYFAHDARSQEPKKSITSSATSSKHNLTQMISTKTTTL